MSLLSQLLSQTAELQRHVEKGLPLDDDERMKFINQLDTMLIERGYLIEKLSGYQVQPFEYDIRKELVERNGAFQQQLVKLQNEIRKNLRQIQLKKETGRKYEQPYEGMTDGAFFDKRGV